MRTGRRPAVLALLVTLLALLLAAPAGAAEDPAAPDPYAADRVVVVGVPGLAWTDLSPDRTPELWSLAEGAPVGAMSVRAARSITCLLDGWATLGAGNRARYPGPEEPETPGGTGPLPEAPAEQPEDEGAASAGLASLCDLQQLIAAGLTDPEQAVRRVAATEGTRLFGADPGALGDQVGCATALGREAALAVAAPGVEPAVRDALPTDDGETAALFEECPLTLVSLDGLVETADLGPDEEGLPLGDDSVRPARAAALAEIDAEIGRVAAVTAAMPGETLLLVQGVSEVDDDRARLHVAVASGPGFDSPAWLTSPSTGREPYVQLIDVAPTALRALGLDAPASMNGQPLRAGGERPGLAAAVAELEELNTAARAHYRSTGILFWTLVAGVAAVVVVGMVTLGRRPDPARAVSSRRRRALRTAALAVAALPVASYLGNLVPWASASSPRLVLLGAVLAADAAVVAFAVAGPWRRHVLGPPLAVLAVTAATLFGDVVTGSSLELNGLLGYDAIVAGRFTGFGNLTFGLVVTSALLLTAAAATAVGRRAGSRLRAAVAGTVAACGLLTVAVIGVPSLGRDFGGVLAALPGFALLAMLLTGIRVTVTRLVLVLAAAVVAVGGLAVLDWLRPAEERSHLGRFVDQLISGEALTVVWRKAQANLDILLGSPLVWTLPPALLAAWWLFRPGGLLRGRPADGDPAGEGPFDGGPPARQDGMTGPDVAALKAGLLACGLSLALGAAVNDSGVAVPAAAAALLVPLLVWLAAAPGTGGPAGAGAPDPAGGAPRARRTRPEDRVTVVSRGSTVSGT